MLLFGLACPVVAQYISRTTCYRTQTPIQVDGRLDEKAWAFAVPLGPFRTNEKAEKPRYATHARLLWDNDYFYLAFKCEDLDIQAEKLRHDQRVWEDDSVEIWGDPDGDNKDILSWHVNPLNTLADIHHPEDNWQERGDLYWNTADLQTAVQVKGTVGDASDQDQGWTVEVAIPWRAFAPFVGDQQLPPPAGALWRIGLYRSDKSQNESSAWSPTRHPYPEEADRFGSVLFSDQTALDRPVLALETYQVREDRGNRDALPDPGEELALSFTLHNHGERAASGVTALLRSRHPQATVVDSLVEIGVLAGGSQLSTVGFRIAIAGDYSPRTPVPMRLLLRDKEEHQWVEDLDLYLDGIVYRPFTRRDIAAGRVLVPSGWKYRAGDDLVWADPGFDDALWESTGTFLQRDQMPAGWQGVGWFRSWVRIDRTLWDIPMALHMTQFGASEIYLDGQLLYTFGKVGTAKEEEQAYRDHTPKVFMFGEQYDHLIAVRYSNFSVAEPLDHLWSVGFFLRLRDLNQSIAERVKEVETDRVLQVVFTGTPLLFALLHLMLFLFYPRAKENLYYAVCTTLFGLTAFFEFQSYFAADQHHDILFVQYMATAGLLATLAALRFVYALYYADLPRPFWVFLAASLALILWQWFAPMMPPIPIIVAVLVFLAEIARVLFMALLKKRPNAWVIGIGFALFILAMTYMLLVTIDVVRPVLGLREWGSQYYGVLCLLASMSIYLARNIALTNKDLEAQLEQVKVLSAKALEEERQRSLLEAENARKTHELEEARKLQLAMLPQAVPASPHLDIAWRMETATEVGGDYYDYSFGEDGALTLALGDATGHGLQSGTMVAATKSLFQALSQAPSIQETFTVMSRSLMGMNLRGMGMAMALLKIREYKLQVSLAGIPPMLLYRVATKEVEEVLLEGMPLGLAKTFSYQEREFHLHPGDTIVLMTDGLPERLNDADQEMGYPRTAALVAEVAEKTPEEICEFLIRKGNEWANGSPQSDDVTIVALRVR